MPEENEPRKHITEALSGRAFVPETHEQREERESAQNYVKGVASVYLSLQSKEMDPEKIDFYEEKWNQCQDILRNLLGMSSEDRQEIIRNYSSLLRQLRAENG